MYSAILYDSIVFMYSHLLPAGFCSSSDLSTGSELAPASVFLAFSSICSELSTGFSTISTGSGIALVQFSSSCCPALIKSLRISGVPPASGSISGKSFSISVCPGMSFGSSTGFSVSCFCGFFVLAASPSLPLTLFSSLSSVALVQSVLFPDTSVCRAPPNSVLRLPLL